MPISMHEFPIKILFFILFTREGVLPGALRTACLRCTKVQKQKALDVITRLYYQHPQIYTALAERYDPNGDYTQNFESWFDEQNAVKPRPPIPQDRVQNDEGRSVNIFFINI